MNFFGMGAMEILVVMLVAFIFLGPERMVDAARFLGKMVGEARRMSAEFRDIVLEEQELDQPTAGTVRRIGNEVRVADSRADSTPDQLATASDDASDDDNGPVAFRSGSVAETPVAKAQESVEPNREQDQG
jgi:sec-independent protein translocase protein TatB